MFGTRTARLAQLLALTLAILVVLPGLAFGDGLEADADALVAATPHANNLSATQEAGTTVAYDFSSQVKNTGNSSNDVFASSGDSVTVTITRSGDWLDGSNGGTPSSFTLTAYDSPEAGTIRVTVPTGTVAGASRTMTVTLLATASNGKALSPSAASLSYTITASAPSDTTPPQTTIDSAPASPTSMTSAAFIYFSSESGSTFQCKLDGGSFASCPAAGKSYTGLGEGSHTFQVFATDAAGNADVTPASHTWTIDLTAPNATIVTGPDALTNSTDAEFTYSSTESGSTFQCKLDGGSFASCPAAGTSYAGLGEGSHTFQVFATDGVGNADPTPDSYTWTIDLTPPAVSAPDLTDASDTGVSHIDNFTKDATPSFTGTAEDGATVALLRDDVVVASTTATGGVWSFTSETLSEGTYSFTARATEAAGNTTTSTVLSVVVDLTDPIITLASRLPAANANGWNNSAVTVTWDCSDDFSGATTTGDSATLSGEGAGQSATGNCSDVAGNTASDAVENINIDLTAPEASATLTSNAVPYTPGTWTKYDVLVTYGCSDALSGTDAIDAPEALGEGENQSASGSCTDKAGNSDEVSVADIDVDKTVPEASASAKTADDNAYTGGWTNQDVTVTFDCADALSGVASLTPVSTVLNTENADQSASAVCTDNAGNTDSASFDDVDIDKTAPTISSPVQSPAANANGWNDSAVTVTWDCGDALSGATTETASDTVSGEGAGQTASATCYDDAGNSAGDSYAGIDIDLTDPYGISWNGGPADGASYYYGFVPGAPTCWAIDDLSLVEFCDVGGYGNGVGSHTMTATATDYAGNDAAAQRSYNVLAWTVTGFYAPVDMNGVWNTVKGGSTVPLKWEMFAGASELTDTSLVALDARLVACPGGTAVEDAIEMTATGGTSLRYDTTGGQFIYNWQTPKKPGTCYRVTMTADDGSSKAALFKLK